MKRKSFFRTCSRRDFLIAGGAVLIGLATGCNRSRNKTDVPNVPSKEPSLIVPKPPTIETATAVGPKTPPASTVTFSITDAVPTPSIELIINNAKVLTMDAADTVAQAISIKDGLIKAVASNELINTSMAQGAQVIDAGGRVVTPGLIDPHNHFRTIGLNNIFYIPFLPPDVTSIPELQNALAKIIKSKNPGEWIQAYYLVLRDGPIPHKQDLDDFSPNNPVFIMHIGGHWGTANSMAMKLANITISTPSPEGGIIEKDANGELTGVFYNHRAMDVLRKAAPAASEELVTSGIVTTQPQMVAAGVTSFQDNNIRDLDSIRAYQQLSKQGLLYMRNDLYYTLEYPANLDNINKIDRYQDAFTRFAGYKFLIDGQLPTAFCHEPHNGTSWNLSTWEANSFKKAVRTLHDDGLQICVHCFGDAAVDLTLDAYEEAMNANPRTDPRHRLEHVVLTKPEATQRIKDLGVVVSTNPQFLYVGGDSYENIFGKERLNRIMVTREWIDAGIHVAIGSDAPTVIWYNPQVTIAGAIGRLAFSKKVIGPDQCMTIQEALRAHTMEAAYAAHEEKIKGSLEAGKLADIAIWDQDPTSATVADLFNMKTVYTTIIGGKVVFQK